MKNHLSAALFFAFAASASGGSFDQLRRGLELPLVPDPAPLSRATEALAGDTRYWITVGADDKYDRTALLNAGLDIIETQKAYVSGLIEAELMDQLAAKGFIVKSRRTIQDYARQHLKDFPAGDAAYHNYKETTDLLLALARRRLRCSPWARPSKAATSGACG